MLLAARENYFCGGRRDLEVGNTEVLAALISGRIDCDVHRIVAADPYPSGQDATVARNSREQDTDARPAIAGTLPPLTAYDVILLDSPILGSHTPMIVSTFTGKLDCSGKTVHPVVTYAVSGLADTAEYYARVCTAATIADGPAALGETFSA